MILGFIFNIILWFKLLNSVLN